MSNAMDSRKAHVPQASAQAGAVHAIPEEITPPPVQAVPVDVQNVVSVKSQKYADPSYDIYASYRTIVLAPSAAGIPSVAQVLNQDELRIQALIVTLNANVVFCRTQDAAQAVGNLQAATGVTNFPSTPQGALISPGSTGGKLGPLDNNETCWVVNCDPVLTAYITVVIERGESA